MMNKKKLPEHLFNLKKTPLINCEEKPIKKLLYKLLFSKKDREEIKKLSFLVESCQIANSWRVLINHYYKSKEKTFHPLPKKNLTTQKIIWQYWDQGIDRAPAIVNICFKSVDKYKGEYKIIRLEDSNISEYIDLPDYIWDKKLKNNIQPAFFSDILRLALLSSYGGIWIDATILLTNNIPRNLLNKNFFMFQRDQNAKQKELFNNFDYKYFSWDNSQKVKSLNSFIIANKNNIIVEDLLNILLIFWEYYQKNDFYFIFQVLFDELINNDLKEYQCEIIDDSLPHLLQLNLDKEFSEELYSSITNRSFIHKLTHKKDKCIEKSIYQYIFSTFQGEP